MSISNNSEPTRLPAVRFTDFVQAQVEKTDPYRVFIDKLTTRRIGAAVGIQLPTIYGLYDSVEAVKLADLPDRFVLKPVHLSSRQGVYLLCRKGPDRFHDLMSRRDLTGTEVLDTLRALTKGKLMAEEMVVDEQGTEEIPCDYKVYAFEDSAPLIVRYNRNVEPLGVSLMDGDFGALPLERYRLERAHGQLVSASPPANAGHVLDACRALMAALDRPFMRIDLYTTGKAVILGELTPSPGGPYHGVPYALSPEFDAELGSLMIRGYQRRGWSIPSIVSPPPSRWADRIFAARRVK